VTPRLASLGAGALFGAGLAISGMTRPEKVLGFLDVTGQWDPSLMLVMVGAIALHFVLFRLILRREAPLFGERFHLPTKRDVDAPLLVGSAIFGVGWGLGGFCPGPALVSIGAGSRDALIFVAAMLAGMLIQHAVSRTPGVPAPAARLGVPDAPDASPGTEPADGEEPAKA
jgi:uncharacterized protein